MLEFDEYKVKLNNCKPELDVLRTALRLEAAEKEIEELEAASAREGFWNDVEKSQKVQKRLKNLKDKVDNFNRLCASWDDMMTMCEMAIEENDDSMLPELQQELLRGAYHENTPAALVYKASWPEEQCLPCTVGTLDACARKHGITKTALVLVGDFLNGTGERSRLYDPAFTTGFRKGKKA